MMAPQLSKDLMGPPLTLGVCVCVCVCVCVRERERERERGTPVIVSSFLGTFTKLWKATVSFVMSVHMEQLSFHWTDFHDIWVYFKSLLRKSKFR